MILRRLKVLSSLLFFIFIISNFHINSTQAANNGVLDITNSPSIVKYSENMTVSITFSDVTNITSVGLIYCQLQPVYMCHYPFNYLTQTITNVFSVNVTIKDQYPAVIGYEIFIEYKNNQTINFPDSRKLDYGLDIVEPANNTYYYKVMLEKSNNTSSTHTNILNFPISSIILSIIGIEVLYFLTKKYRHRNFR